MPSETHSKPSPSGEIHPNSRQRVRLMLTCLCDSYFGEVGIATVRCLEHAGCDVVFDKDQTCCGQPPFNAGDWTSARQAAGFTMRRLLDSDEPVVAPSGSCAAMVREGYPLLYQGMNHPVVYELSEFLVHQLKLESWPINATQLPSKRKIALHRACHGRAIGLKNEQAQLVGSLPWIEMMEFGQQEQCCGFGGAFCATHNSVSAGIGMEKLHNIIDSGAQEIVSGDMGCLLHLNGLIHRNKLPLTTRHFSELLAEAIA